MKILGSVLPARSLVGMCVVSLCLLAVVGCSSVSYSVQVNGDKNLVSIPGAGTTSKTVTTGTVDAKASADGTQVSPTVTASDNAVTGGGDSTAGATGSRSVEAETVAESATEPEAEKVAAENAESTEKAAEGEGGK